MLGGSAARACLKGAEWEQKSHGGPSLFPKHSPQKLGYVIFVIFPGSVINIFFSFGSKKLELRNVKELTWRSELVRCIGRANPKPIWPLGNPILAVAYYWHVSEMVRVSHIARMVSSWSEYGLLFQ